MPLTDQEFFDNYCNCVIKYLVDNQQKYNPEKVELRDDSGTLHIYKWSYEIDQPSNTLLKSYDLEDVDYQYKLYLAQSNTQTIPQLTLAQWESIGPVADNTIFFIVDDSSLRLYNNGSWIIYAGSEPMQKKFISESASPISTGFVDISDADKKQLVEDIELEKDMLDLSILIKKDKQEIRPAAQPDPIIKNNIFGQ